MTYEGGSVVKVTIVRKSKNYRTLGLAKMRIVRNVRNVLCFRERESVAKKSRMLFRESLAEKRGRNEKSACAQKSPNIRTIQNNCHKCNAFLRQNPI